MSNLSPFSGGIRPAGHCGPVYLSYVIPSDFRKLGFFSYVRFLDKHDMKPFVRPNHATREHPPRRSRNIRPPSPSATERSLTMAMAIPNFNGATDDIPQHPVHLDVSTYCDVRSKLNGI